MKKPILLISAILFLILTGIAQQIDFSSHVVDSDFYGPAGIFIVDIDNDSMKDIISAGADGNTVAWWKNIGGHPLEFVRQDIDVNFSGAIYVYPGDIDDDGFVDVLAAGWNANELAWWRNDGSSPIEWAKHTIRLNFLDAHEIMAVDFDKDGDMDVLGVSARLNQISLFENDGNWPITWTEHVIDTDFDGARSVDAKDIDGDGDIDFCGAALDDNEIAWWRNDGGDSIQFTRFIVGSSFNYAHKVQIIDMDKDGEEDILGTSFSNGLSWWKNSGGDSIAWTKKYVSGFGSAVIGWSFDADGDNDLDIVCSAQTSSGKIGIWFNDGELPVSWSFQMIENDFAETWPLHYGDLDNDGDIDFVCGGSAANEIRWYENDLVTAVPNTIHNKGGKQHLSCYPVPSMEEVSIHLKLDECQMVNLSIYDLTGRLIKVLANEDLGEGDHVFQWGGQGNSEKMNGQQLYFVHLQTDKYRETVKLIMN